uniref:Uncharacterized protein n=1 Tax=Lygus hesperus TaxID=30085 RepID=A0A146LN30_LYGHE
MMDEILMCMAYMKLESKDDALIELPSAADGGSLRLLGRLNKETKANDEVGHRVRRQGSKSVSLSRNNSSASTGEERVSDLAITTAGMHGKFASTSSATAMTGGKNDSTDSRTNNFAAASVAFQGGSISATPSQRGSAQVRTDGRGKDEGEIGVKLPDSVH